MRPLVSFQPVPFGDAGAIATLHTMRNLVEDARASRWAVATARATLDASLTDDADAIIERIGDWFAERFQFATDPAPMDRVSSPVLLLQELQSRGVVRGDCDDAAVLAAFFGSVQGILYRFRAVGFSSEGPLSHVFTLLRSRAGYIPLDVTANAKQVVPAARRVLDFP